MKRICIGACVIFLSACTQASSVTELGGGVYSVVARAPSTAGGNLAAKKRAFFIAENFCRDGYKKKASLLEVTHEEIHPWPAESSAKITFGCVDDGDPLLKNNNQILMTDEEKMQSKDNKDPFAELNENTPSKPFE